jgi:hypothetical protein
MEFYGRQIFERETAANGICARRSFRDGQPPIVNSHDHLTAPASEERRVPRLPMKYHFPVETLSRGEQMRSIGTDCMSVTRWSASSLHRYARNCGSR